MINTEIGIVDVRNQLKRMKIKKAPGPNEIKNELYKHIQKDEMLLEILGRLLHNILKNSNIPEGWKVSLTKLLEKLNRPTTTDLRPLALMNSSYKLFMGILKDKTETHLKENNILNEQQAGATPGRRVVDNLFILKYCIEQSFIKRNKLFLITTDFSKAFDSIKRCKLIQVLKKYKVDEYIIDVVCAIYSQDRTELVINDQKYATINITSGIKQGCNLSALLFVLVTYYIIEKMNETGMGYSDEYFNILTLFYMDDALLLAQTRDEAITIVNLFERYASECGLKLNKRKGKIIVFNAIENEERIGEIEVVKELHIWK